MEIFEELKRTQALGTQVQVGSTLSTQQAEATAMATTQREPQGGGSHGDTGAMGVTVRVLAFPLLTQLTSQVPVRAAEDSPNPGAPVPTLRIPS